jgi:hypothetical protein
VVGPVLLGGPAPGGTDLDTGDDDPQVGRLIAGCGGIAGDEARLGVDGEGPDDAGLGAIVAEGERTDLGHGGTPVLCSSPRPSRPCGERGPRDGRPAPSGRSACEGRRAAILLLREERRSRGEEDRRRAVAGNRPGRRPHRGADPPRQDPSVAGHHGTRQNQPDPGVLTSHDSTRYYRRRSEWQPPRIIVPSPHAKKETTCRQAFMFVRTRSGPLKSGNGCGPRGGLCSMAS